MDLRAPHRDFLVESADREYQAVPHNLTPVDDLSGEQLADCRLDVSYVREPDYYIVSTMTREIFMIGVMEVQFELWVLWSH